MDYKYIEQLIERYWQCETSLEEEEILHLFFQQKDVPAHLLRYKDLFCFEKEEKELKVSDDFEAKVLEKIEKPVVKAKRISISRQIMPFFKAAAVVAIILSLGNAIQKSSLGEENDYNYENYTDTYTDPQVAYDEISSALQDVSEGISKSKVLEDTDTLVSTTPATKELIKE